MIEKLETMHRSVNHKIYFFIAFLVVLLYLSYTFIIIDGSDRTFYKNGAKSLYIYNVNPFSELEDDKVLKQNAYVSSNYNVITAKVKHIFIPTDSEGLGNNLIRQGFDNFKNCPVSKCFISTLATYKNEVPDAIIYNRFYVDYKVPFKPNQVTIFFTQESPYNTPVFEKPSIINWTATYREDSDIPVPYFKWKLYNNSITSLKPTKNYAQNKIRKVAWFVSNCRTTNRRLEYAKELQKYFDVDIYGNCGDKVCSRSNEQKCYEIMAQYKFYLSFENSNCIDYITEKFFLNALRHDILPIVMGAPYENYVKAAPKNSFIHVDQFASAKELAEYLNKLDQDDALYNSYFEWKETGEILNSNLYCRICSLLHSSYKEKTYEDINVWWKREGICTTESWKNVFL